MSVSEQLLRPAPMRRPIELVAAPVYDHPTGHLGTAPSPLAELFRKRRHDGPQGTERDYDSAFDLVSRASQAIEHLQSRFERLEADSKAAADRLRQELEAAETAARDWQQVAAAMRSELDERDRRIAALERRALDAESLAQSEAERADAAEHRAAADGKLASSFHDRILTAFGTGSRAHAALEAAAGR